MKVENALDVYEHLDNWFPASLNDILTAYTTLMNDLIKESGLFCSGGAGILKGKDVVYIAPQASLVPTPLNQLLQ